MLELAQIQDILNEIPLFAGSSPECLREIASIARERNCAKGTIIYASGTEALDMFVLLRGLVSFTTETGVGLLNVQTVMKRHMIFGWASLVPEHPRRIGTAECLEECTILSINGDALLDILSRHPQAGFVIMKRLCSLIARTFVDKG